MFVNAAPLGLSNRKTVQGRNSGGKSVTFAARLPCASINPLKVPSAGFACGRYSHREGRLHSSAFMLQKNLSHLGSLWSP